MTPAFEHHNCIFVCLVSEEWWMPSGGRTPDRRTGLEHVRPQVPFCNFMLLVASCVWF